MSSLPVSRLISSLAASSVLALAVGLSGCASSYTVKVDALCNPDVAPGAAYRIVPRDAVKADFEPQYQHAVQLIETALATKGYHPAETVRDADIVIEVDFGIGSQRKRVTEDVELFAPTQHNRSASGPATNSPLAQNLESEAQPQPPITRVTVVTVYEKFLSLSARETNRATAGLRRPVELWRVTTAIEDGDETVDACLPVLVTTATEHIGASTGARTSIRVTEKSSNAVFAQNDR